MVRKPLICEICDDEKPAFRFEDGENICKKCKGYISRSKRRKQGISYLTLKKSKRYATI